MRILVTGGGGFLGQYVVRELKENGYDVVAFQRRGHPELETSGVRVVRGSLLDGNDLRTALQGCDGVVHIAAKAGVWGPRSEYFETNVEGTRLLLDSMEKTRVQKLVYCSTASVVFRGQSLSGENESVPYGKNWLCPYPETKAIAEEMALRWGRAGKGRVIALRPHLIWGTGDPHLLPVVIERGRLGKLRQIGEGINRVDLTRVENVARAHVLALDALDRPSACNRPYFISQGQPVVLWDWINDMLRRIGIPQVCDRMSYPVAYLAGGILELTWRMLGRDSMPPMTRFIAVELAKDHWFSIDAARRELGYDPQDFPMEKGMEAYADGWRSGDTR